jgi:hypothetical protein
MLNTFLEFVITTEGIHKHRLHNNMNAGMHEDSSTTTGISRALIPLARNAIEQFVT